MARIQRSALLPYNAEQLYALINDVAAYPQFLDGCVGTEIFEHSETSMRARLDLAKAGLTFSFTTQNTLKRPTQIVLELVEGPFSEFQGVWTIEPLDDQACKVSLSLTFSVTGKVLGLAAKSLFNPLADRLVDSLVVRAHQLYRQ